MRDVRMQMSPVSQKATDRRRATAGSRLVLVPVIALVLGVLAAGTSWAFLVRAAIDFGRAAREGNGPTGWALMGCAGAGAAVCLLLVLVLLARAGDQLRSRNRRPGADAPRHRQKAG